MNEMNFSETTAAGKMMMIGEPRQYRADCKAGAFKIGKNDLVGRTLKVEPVGAKLVEDQLFNYDRQKWVELLFVDESGLISTILFKGESLRNFMETYRKAIVAGQTMNALQLLARMAERANEYGQYFAVEFEILGAGKFAEQIAAIEKEKVSGMFRIDSLPRGNGNGNGNGHEPEETTAIATTTRKVAKR